MSKPTPRSEVFTALDTEREYQKLKWNEQPHEIDAFCNYITGYSIELTRVSSHTDNVQQRLDFIRKVGALCVAAMEQHGAPCRTQAEMDAARAFGEKRASYVAPATVQTTANEPVTDPVAALPSTDVPAVTTAEPVALAEPVDTADVAGDQPAAQA